MEFCFFIQGFHLLSFYTKTLFVFYVKFKKNYFEKEMKNVIMFL